MQEREREGEREGEKQTLHHNAILLCLQSGWETLTLRSSCILTPAVFLTDLSFFFRCEIVDNVELFPDFLGCLAFDHGSDLGLSAHTVVSSRNLKAHNDFRDPASSTNSKSMDHQHCACKRQFYLNEGAMSALNTWRISDISLCNERHKQQG